MTTENLLFSTSAKFEIISLDKRDSVLIIKIKSIQLTSCCPSCQVPAEKIHSYYLRKIKDVPAFGSALDRSVQDQITFHRLQRIVDLALGLAAGNLQNKAKRRQIPTGK